MSGFFDPFGSSSSGGGGGSTPNDGTLTIQKNGTTVGIFTANQATNETINIVVPTSAGDVSALPDTTKYGASLLLEINSSTFVVTATLKDQNGDTLGTAQTIDLPLESVVVNGSYDSTTKKIVLTLKNGSTVEFSVADLVSGLQTEITSTNKLNADLVDDTNTTHKFVTASDKTAWNNKQNVLIVGTNLDDEPIEDSTNPITSGGVYNTVGNIDVALDSLIMSLEPKTITANGTYNPADDGVDGYNSVSVDVPNSFTAQDEGKVVDNGQLVAQTDYGTVTENGIYDTTTNNSITVNISKTPNFELLKTSCKPSINFGFLNNWSTKTWSGLTDFDGRHIWTDGTDIYYSWMSSQYVLDKVTSTWRTKTWSGLTNFYGTSIWTDGENIYYSSQYVLDKVTSTWRTKTWNGLTNFSGMDIWTDGTDIYYSNNSYQYVLDKATSTWQRKSWSGLTNFHGNEIWTDGTDIYYSYYSDNSYQYVLDKATSTWQRKSWSGLTNFYGGDIWTDGTDIYYSEDSYQYVLDKATSTWQRKSWLTEINFMGDNFWTDGTDIYYSSNSHHYVLDKATKRTPSVKSC